MCQLANKDSRYEKLIYWFNSEVFHWYKTKPDKEKESDSSGFDNVNIGNLTLQNDLDSDSNKGDSGNSYGSIDSNLVCQYLVELSIVLMPYCHNIAWICLS